jgi:hypothetical protein
MRWGLGVNHPTPSGSEAKNEWSYTSTPLLCFHGMLGETFTFLALVLLFKEFICDVSFASISMYQGKILVFTEEDTAF